MVGHGDDGIMLLFCPTEQLARPCGRMIFAYA